MSIAITNRLAGADAADQTSYAFTGITVSASTWLVIDVFNDKLATGSPAATPTLSGGGLTYTQELTWPLSTVNRRLSRFYAWTSSVTSLDLTVDFGSETQDVCICHVNEVSGADTADPFVTGNTKSDEGTGTATDGPTLDAYSHADNRFILAVYHAADSATTEEHTQLADYPGAANCRLSTSWSSTTQDLTPTASWVASVNWAAITSEIAIESGAAAATILDPFGASGFFGA